MVGSKARRSRKLRSILDQPVKVFDKYGLFVEGKLNIRKVQTLTTPYQTREGFYVGETHLPLRYLTVNETDNEVYIRW